MYRVGAKVCREVAVLRGYLSSVECLAVQDVGRRVVLVGGGVGSSMLRGTDRQRKKPWRLAQEKLVVDCGEGETKYLVVDTRWEVEGTMLLMDISIFIAAKLFVTKIATLHVILRYFLLFDRFGKMILAKNGMIFGTIRRHIKMP